MSETIAIVIAATDSNEAVQRCVDSLQGRGRIVVAYDPSRIDGWRLPGNLIAVAGGFGADAHRLRACGFGETSENIIVFTEDSCILSPNWLDAWMEAFENPQVQAATGPVELAGGSTWIDEAVFLCEYGPFLTAFTGGQVGRLSGNNFAVRRDLIGLNARDIHESEVARQCRQIQLVPSAVAVHARRFLLPQAINDRLRFGFGFGRLCAENASVIRRLSRILGGPGILLSQVGRLVFTLASKRRGGGAILTAGLPTVAFLTAWSVAEWLGWIVGPSRKPGERADQLPSSRTDRFASPPPNYRDKRAVA